MLVLRTPLVRLFCVCCAAVVLPLAPLTLATIGTARQHPISLEGSRAIGGGAVRTANGAVIEAIRFGDAEWTAAASPEARRRFRNVPAGQEIAYRMRGGSIVTGRVASVRAETSQIVRRAVLALLALVATLAGLALGLAGQNRAASSAGGFLSGLGATLGFGFLEPNLVLIAAPPLRDAAIVLFALVPAALWCRYLLLLAADFPAALPLRRWERLAIAAVSAIAIARAALLASSQIGPFFDALPFRAAILALLESELLQVVPYLLAAVTALVLIVRQAQTAAEQETRERARLVAQACAVGIGIPLLGAIAQATSLLALRRLLLPRHLMALLLLPLLLVPLSLTYALLARRVERAGVLARRAVVYAVADRTLLLLALVPLVVLFAGRESRVTVFALVAIAALLLAAAIRRALARLFFRERNESRSVLAGASRTLRDAADAGALAERLAGAIDEALHVETIALFLDDRAEGVLADPRQGLAPLQLSSPLARGAADAETLLVDDGVLAALSDVDRAWVEQGQFRLLVPLVSSDRRLLALLALGEKMSGLPYDREDRLLLATVASSAALALENLRLRHGAGPSEQRREGAATALLCDACGAVFDPLEAVRCASDGSPLVPAAVPYVLHGKFRFEQRIGAGAMGVVYRARDLVLGRDIAIKTLPVLAGDAATRFESEARAVAALSHPSIATIHAAEMWHGRPMLVFELLRGGTLQDRMSEGPMSIADVVTIATEVAAALAHAHAAGMLHRDIKPPNIGFAPDGTAKVLDFGLAHLIDGTASAQPAGIAGTARYLSPESVLGNAPTPLVDVWSTALTFYEALTGVNPFAAPTATRTMNRILTVVPPDPSTLRPDIPPALAALLLRALHRDPAQRIRTASELRDALRSL
jgi:hypothetical protein